MSYIVPREKPHYCIDCIFLDRNYRDCKLQKVDYCDFNKQYKNCPLIDIPTPHGRLIDADKVEYEKVYIDDVGKSYEMVGKDDIEEAPTVIEAEGEI